MPRFWLLVLLLMASSTATAIVIRDGVDDSKYRIPTSEFPALVDMPGEGHGVLIASQWVVTAADTIPRHSDLKQVGINGVARDVERVAVYKDSDEPGQVVKIVGKGATGTGSTGHDPIGPNRTELRRAFNKITSAHDRWFCFVFDEPQSALPLEGIGGNGDSGGPMRVLNCFPVATCDWIDLTSRPPPTVQARQP